jgi:multifunctional 2-oxoglutarate metabolism enzyme
LISPISNGHVGVEYTHILEPEQQKWLQERIEVKHDKPTVAEQKYMLSKLTPDTRRAF